MSTFLAKPGSLPDNWYIIDAAGVPLGRTAVKAANILRGKHRPEFTPNVDSGEHVIIINAKDAVVTGNKADDKKYYRVTGYIGHMKETNYKTMLQTKPTRAMELAVWGMLPHNTLGRKQYKKLKVYAGAEHGHEAQKPIVLEREGN